MRLSLIITTYNWPESLELVLKSIEKQTLRPDEVVIADDGSSFETQNLVTELQQVSKLNIIHSWQEDIGFRAARSRNKAILKSTGDYIILIDGDMILHSEFVKDHVDHAKKGYFSQGSRVLLSKDLSKNALHKQQSIFSFFSSGLKNRKNSIHSKLLSFIFSNKKNQLRGIKTHNFAFYLKDCLNINGFNNEFEGWGREDSEFVVRMQNSGIKRRNIRFNAIQFHIWHNVNKNVSLDRNNLILKNTINNHLQWCESGINSIEINES